MVEKKEIFDYLRNRQKAAEIEAKVNGINLWVLVGAITVVTWQLLGSPAGLLWSQPELILRILLCAETLYLLSWCDANGPNKRGEIRYLKWRPAEMESPLLRLLQGTLLLLPPLLSLVLIGKSWGAGILGFFGLGIFGMSAWAICSRVLQIEKDTDKFPKPEFAPTMRSAVLSDVFFAIAFLLVIFEQGKFAWEHREIFTVDLVKQLSLLATLYLLFIVTIDRKFRSNGIAWTYELETEVLLGTVSPEVAIRRIEHRGLGPRLQDVMDQFFDDMDRRINELNSLYNRCRLKLESVKEVPQEYGAERAARIQDATKDLSVQIEALFRDCSEFEDYLKKLGEKNVGARKKILAPHLTSLKARHETYVKRIRSVKANLETMTTALGDSPKSLIVA